MHRCDEVCVLSNIHISSAWKEMAFPKLLIDTKRTYEYDYTAFGLPTKLLSQLQTMREQELFTDITVHVDGQAFCCHKLVLAASSPYFKAWFEHQTGAHQKEEIVIGKISPLGFSPILEYFYTSKLHFTADIMVDVLDAADYLQLRDIAELCCRMLLQHITVNTCLSLQQLGDGHLYAPLAEAAKEYTLSHFSDVAGTRDFLQLSYAHLQNLISDKKLHVKSEVKLFEGILQWIEFDSSRAQYRGSLMECVDFSLLDGTGHRACDNTWHGSEQIDAISNSIETMFEQCHIPVNDSPLTIQGDGSESKRDRGIDRLHPVMVVCPTSTKHTNKEQSTSVYCYDFQGNKWEELTKLPFFDRSFFSVTELDNVIFITGGENNDRSVKHALQYSVASDEWDSLQPMLQARSNHSSVATRGKLFIVGGAGPESNCLRNDGETFDPETGQWTMLPELLDVVGIGHCALVPLDGKLFVFGGTQSYFNEQTKDVRKKQYNEAQCYDLDKDMWLRSYNFTDILSSQFHLSVGVGTGDALPYCGFILILDENLRGRKIRLYNPVTETATSFIHTHGQHRFGGYVIFDEVLYCSGGLTQQLATNDMLHCASLRDEDDSSSGWKMLASLPFGISHHASFVIFKRIS